jgi:hypothetical protein
MLPYIGPEIVEALKSVAADRLAKNASSYVSPKPLAGKRKEYFTPLRRVTGRLRSLIMVVVTNKLILLLIHACL